MAYHRYHKLDARSSASSALTVHACACVTGARCQFHRASAPQRGRHDFGSGRQTRSFCYISDLDGHHCPDGIRRERTGEHRQSARDDHRGNGPADCADDRLEEPHRLQAIANRRSAGASAGHHTRKDLAGLGTEGRTRPEVDVDDRLLPRKSEGLGPFSLSCSELGAEFRPHCPRFVPYGSTRK